MDVLNFTKKVQSASKVMHSSKPQVRLLSTKDKFNINPAAQSMMGVDAESGDRVTMMDMNLNVSDPSQLMSIGDRFYITKNLYSNDKKGKLDGNGNFSFTAIWSAMLINKPDVVFVKHRDVVDADLAIERKNSKGFKNFIGLKQITFDLERLVQEDEDGNEVTTFSVVEGEEPQEVFRLINPVWEDHKPKTHDSDEDVDTDEDETYED